MSAPALPPSGPAPERSPVGGYAGGSETTTDRTGDLRDELAAVLDPVAFDPNTAPKNLGQDWDLEQRTMVALDHAERAIRAGWRRVTEDPEREIEIRALEKAFERSRTQAGQARSEGLDRETCRFYQGMNSWLRRRIEALRNGEEPDWDDAFDSAAVLRGGEQR